MHYCRKDPLLCKVKRAGGGVRLIYLEYFLYLAYLAYVAFELSHFYFGLLRGEIGIAQRFDDI